MSYNQKTYYEQVWAMARQIPHPEEISPEDYQASASRWVDEPRQGRLY